MTPTFFLVQSNTNVSLTLPLSCVSYINTTSILLQTVNLLNGLHDIFFTRDMFASSSCAIVNMVTIISLSLPVSNRVQLNLDISRVCWPHYESTEQNIEKDGHIMMSN